MKWLVWLVLLVAVSPAMGQEPPQPVPANPTLTPKEQYRKLRDAYKAADLLGGEYISEKDEFHIKEKVVGQAALVEGASVTGLTDLEELAAEPPAPPSFGEKVAGFFTFLNIVKVTAALLLAVSVFWLAGIYLLALVLLISPRVWEVVCYAVCGGLVYLGTVVDSDFSLLVALPGCFGLVGALSLTCQIHWPDEKKRYYTVWAGICAVAWAGAAVLLDSQVVGFMSMLAFLSALGFVAALEPFCLYIGFESDSAIFRAGTAALVMLTAFVVFTLTGWVNHVYELFRPGLQFLGSFVYFLALLILGSKFYWKWFSTGRNLFWPMQAVVIVSGVAALYLGSVFGMGALLGVGGTFFYIYLLEKYFEIPWNGSSWAWCLLGLAGILYGLVMFAQRHPQYFLFYGR